MKTRCRHNFALITHSEVRTKA